MSNTNLPWRRYICLACGLIYDEEKGDPDSGLAPGTRFEDIPDDWECPLCGVTKSDFALLEAPSVPQMVSSSLGQGQGQEPGIVILGGGIAGWTTAEAIRALDTEVPITLISACSADRYHKPELSVALSRRLQKDDLVRESGPDAAQRLGIRLLNHTFAVGLSPKLHQIRTTRGTLPYTRLVLAMGATPALPAELPPSECWRINDLQGWAGLYASLDQAGSEVAIVGAGMVGCELAEDLAHAGHRVTLIDRNTYPLSGLIPPEAGVALQDALRGLGINFINDTHVLSLTSLPSGKRCLQLSNGDSLQVDQVVAATGLKTDSRLPAMAGLAFDGGIQVNPGTLETSIEHIYALGDCISLGGHPCRFIEPIRHQAQVIAHRILNLDFEDYSHQPPVIRLKTRSLALVIHGRPHKDGQWTITHQSEGLLEMQQHLGRQRVATLTLGKPQRKKAA